METLYDKLKEYKDSDYYPFHMPGHKRNHNFMDADLPYGMDITEIDGFDDLHHASGILKDAQERAAKLYHAEETCFLINGSTVGILSAVMGSTRKGDKILAARNCHKSVYHAIEMQELEVSYIYPGFCEDIQLNGEIDPGGVDRILKQDAGIRAVVVTSPTYDGVVSDIKAIADVVHRYGIPLIVDEAHGAHFGFHPYFPENANQLGADVVIHSLHKTLPSLTQTGLIHMNGPYADRRKIKKYLHMLQTSSPSYVLMAGMDACMDMLEKKGNQVFDSYVSRLKRMRRETDHLKCLRCVVSERFDLSKFVISTEGTDLSSTELYSLLLERYHLQMEMKSGNYVLAMTGIADTWDGFQRLSDALVKIDKGVRKTGKRQPKSKLPGTDRIYKISRALDISGETIQKKWEESAGYISAEYAYLYPPGIPLVVPGERITEEIVQCMNDYRKLGFDIQGTAEDNRVEVLING